MSDDPERDIEPALADALSTAGLDITQQVYQPGPYWYVDIVARGPLATFYIEVENDGDADTVRHGMMQAEGYAAAANDPRAIPVLIIPTDHAEHPDWDILTAAFDGLALRFDPDTQTFH